MIDLTYRFVEFDPALVAYLPGNVLIRLDESADGLSMKQRAFARALLSEALRLLDETEPCSTVGGGR